MYAREIFITVVVFCLSFLMYLLGYYFGKSDGVLKGMSSLLSIFKVYNPDLIDDISTTFANIQSMSPEDKENAFYDYIEKHNL